MRTQVGIVGGGPAGLFLARLLQLEGIESVVIEARSREYVEGRVRAGVLEQGTVDILHQLGAAEHLHRHGLVHHGIELRFNGQGHRIDMHALTGGRSITIYGQNEVVRDLTKVCLAGGAEIVFEAENASIHELESAKPRIRFQKDGSDCELSCDFIAGCDGSHGISRASGPGGVFCAYERVYPFGWLGILVAASPPCKELIYTHHERGFALVSMRSPQVTRLYLQCAPDENINDWSEDRIWSELECRLATVDGPFKLNQGRIFQKGVTGMRSFVTEPMQYGNLFLAGDSAHLVPPTGAKGLNLAVADVVVLARALTKFYRSGDRDGLNRYSETCLRHVWKVQRFSWWMTSMLHRFEDANPFDQRRQVAELEYVVGSQAAATSLAENYVGLAIA